VNARAVGRRGNDLIQSHKTVSTCNLQNMRIQTSEGGAAFIQKCGNEINVSKTKQFKISSLYH